MSLRFDCCCVNESNSVIVWQIKCQDKQYAELGDEKWKSSHTGADLCLAAGPRRQRQENHNISTVVSTFLPLVGSGIFIKVSGPYSRD